MKALKKEVGGGVRMRRAWAMPSKHTFTIPPIAELLGRFPMEEFVDPFAGWNSPARYRNDLNPEAPVEAHVDAEEFICTFSEILGLLFDPPYSPRQISELYKGIGFKVGMKETQSAALYSRVRNAAAKRMPVGSVSISFGWNSVGMGIKRGFEIEEILLVCHGGAHNDTIVVVERKVLSQSDFF